MDIITKTTGILENLKKLTGRCGWEIPKDMCTVDELLLQKQYEELSTQYYMLLGLIPEQLVFVQN